MATEQVSLTQQRSTSQRYYKVQLKGWTTFDPSELDLSDIAQRVDRGKGFLTAIEVVKVADDVSAVDDAEVRERFENILAVERIVENIGDIPQSLLEKLHAALSSSGQGKNLAQGSDRNLTQAA